MPPTDPQSQDLAHRVSLFLRTQHVTVGAPLHITADQGVVTISGYVPTFHQRQIILALARRVAGVLRVNDRLHVASPTESGFAAPSGHTVSPWANQPPFSSLVA